MAVDYNDELSPFISIVKGDNPDYAINWKITSRLPKHKKTTTYDDGNPDPGLGHAQKCGRVKQKNLQIHFTQKDPKNMDDSDSKNIVQKWCFEFPSVSTSNFTDPKVFGEFNVQYFHQSFLQINEIHL
jgi:hypothetical protein